MTDKELIKNLRDALKWEREQNKSVQSRLNTLSNTHEYTIRTLRGVFNEMVEIVCGGKGVNIAWVIQKIATILGARNT